MANTANTIWQFKKALTLGYISALETVEDLEPEEWELLVSNTLTTYVSTTMSKVERQNVVLEYGIWKSVRDTVDRSIFDDADDNIELKITYNILRNALGDIGSLILYIDFQAFGEQRYKVSEKVCFHCKMPCVREDDEGCLICEACENQGY